MHEHDVSQRRGGEHNQMKRQIKLQKHVVARRCGSKLVKFGEGFTRQHSYNHRAPTNCAGEACFPTSPSVQAFLVPEHAQLSRPPVLHHLRTYKSPVDLLHQLLVRADPVRKENIPNILLLLNEFASGRKCEVQSCGGISGIGPGKWRLPGVCQCRWQRGSMKNGREARELHAFGG